MTQRRPNPYAQSERHVVPLELVLECDGPLPAHQAREVARRLLESLRVSAPDAAAPARLRDSRIICHALRQVVRLTAQGEE